MLPAPLSSGLTEPPALVAHRRISHAAHYAYGRAGGHDLEEWTIRSPQKPTYEQIVALGLPSDAKYHSGSVRDGVQHWTWTAIRPLSAGTCSRCEVRS